MNDQARDQVRTSIKSTGIKGVMYRPTWSASQLSIDVSDLHADANGRLEISCLSTIPAKLLQPGDEYADFKIYSVKSELIKIEVTFDMPYDVEEGKMSRVECFEFQYF